MILLAADPVPPPAPAAAIEIGSDRAFPQGLSVVAGLANPEWAAGGIKGGLVSVYKLDSDRHVPIGVENIIDNKTDFSPQDLALRDRILAQIATAHKQ